MGIEPGTATAFIATIVIVITAGIAAYMHLLPMVQGAITATQKMLEDIGALKTAAAVHTTQIQAHDQQINGAMQDRIQAVIDRSALAAVPVVAPVVVPAPGVPGGRRAADGPPVVVAAPTVNALTARIAVLQAEIDAATRLGGDAPATPA